MLTHQKNYHTKVAGVMSTWGQEVSQSSKDALLIVGDKNSTDPPVVTASPPCGNDHNDQLVCKAGIALQRAYQNCWPVQRVFLVFSKNIDFCKSFLGYLKEFQGQNGRWR